MKFLNKLFNFFHGLYTRWLFTPNQSFRSLYAPYLVLTPDMYKNKLLVFISRHERVFTVCRYFLLLVAAVLIIQGCAAMYSELVVSPVLRSFFPFFLKAIHSGPDKSMLDSLVTNVGTVFEKTVPLKMSVAFSFVREVSFLLGIIGVVLFFSILGAVSNWGRLIEAKPPVLYLSSFFFIVCIPYFWSREILRVTCLYSLYKFHFFLSIFVRYLLHITFFLCLYLFLL